MSVVAGSELAKPTNDVKAEVELNGLPTDEEEVFNNFATPLLGQFLNLPRQAVDIKCPGCGIKQPSHVENNEKWWAVELNRIFGWLFVCLCCCCCFDYYIPCKQTDRNHYCKNCGCYFGRSMKHKRIRPSKK